MGNQEGKPFVCEVEISNQQNVLVYVLRVPIQRINKIIEVKIMSKKTCFFKLLSLSLCIVLIVVSALFLAGCNNQSTSPTPTPLEQTEGTPIPPTTVGEGTTEFTFEIAFPDGSTKTYLVKTDKTVVGDALQELGLISGEESTYGLYVKTVDGVTVDYTVDGKYWAFYANGQMAPTGVDSTQLEAGVTYAFKAE